MKYLLWDFDNTLAYRDGMWSNTLCDLLHEFGYNDYQLDDVRVYLKNGFPWHSPEMSHKEFFKEKQWWDYMNEYFAKILNSLGIEDNIAHSLSKQVKERYLNPRKWHVYDDTVSCLKSTIEKGYSNIIVSNHVPELEKIVENLGIKDYFRKVYSSAHIGYEKPNIKIYEKVIMELNNIESVTMIGDSYSADVQGAKNAGIEAILVRKTNDCNYDKYFSSLDDLKKFL